jgi:hypothetical protein
MFVLDHGTRLLVWIESDPAIGQDHVTHRHAMKCPLSPRTHAALLALRLA